MPKYYNKQTKKWEEKGTLRGTKSDSDIVGKTARLKEVTRGEKNKAIADFKKMKEKNLANFTRPSSKAGMSSKSSGSSKSPTAAPEKKFNVGVSKGGVSFGEAFKHFRNKGAKEFTWNGQKYTTKMK